MSEYSVVLYIGPPSVFPSIVLIIPSSHYSPNTAFPLTFPQLAMHKLLRRQLVETLHAASAEGRHTLTEEEESSLVFTKERLQEDADKQMGAALELHKGAVARMKVVRAEQKAWVERRAVDLLGDRAFNEKHFPDKKAKKAAEEEEEKKKEKEKEDDNDDDDDDDAADGEGDTEQLG